ncbi:MAG TPA: YbbR-like domain-containing protein [candidate division Zixibacteria bacterium]|nr:YbbR-like domain-containing protein [candidate division Zixibacteria bacterium]
MTKLFENLWLKIIALFFGLLLWFHVATEKNYTYQLYLPVSKIILKDGLTLNSKPPDSLMVTVSATGKQLMRKKWRSRGLKIIASQFTSGQYDLNLNTSNVLITSTTTDVTLSEILSPSNIKISVDKIAEVLVKVKLDLLAEADEGYAVSSVSSIVPDEIKLKGPQTLVSKIPIIFTEHKVLKGLRNNIELTLPLAKPFGYGIEVIPDSVSLFIEVVPVKTRVFNQIPIVLYNPPLDSVVELVPKFVQIELTGPPTEIDLLNENTITASADYNEKTSERKALLTIDCPVKFKIRKANPDSVLLITK